MKAPLFPLLYRSHDVKSTLEITVFSGPLTKNRFRFPSSCLLFPPSSGLTPLTPRTHQPLLLVPTSPYTANLPFLSAIRTQFHASLYKGNFPLLLPLTTTPHCHLSSHCSVVLYCHPTRSIFTANLYYPPALLTFTTTLYYHPALLTFTTTLYCHPTLLTFTVNIYYQPLLPPRTANLYYHPALLTFTTNLYYHPTLLTFTTTPHC